MIDEHSPEFDALTQFVAERPIAVLTGAGVSTDSGIPDYRGAGTPPRTPMSIAQFMNDTRYRKRFWAGALVNYARTKQVTPNAGHLALAQLEASGHVTGVITQNVDDLHNQAGSQRVVELHGNGNVIVCISGDHRWYRAQVLEWVRTLNPGFLDAHSDAEIAPDGDALVTEIDAVRVPLCPGCGATLRPSVVYFGEHVPTQVFADAESVLAESEGLLVAGSSLAVNTGIRLVARAARRGVPIAVINRGPSAADARATIRIKGGTSETLTALVRAVAAQAPRP